MAKKREVEIELKVTSKTDEAARQLKQLGDTAARAGQGSTRFNGAVGGEAANKVDSAFKELGTKAAVVTAVFQTVTRGMENAAKAVNLLNNASLSSAQQLTVLAEEWVPGAKAFREFRDAMNGTTETLRANQAKFADLTLAQEQTFAGAAERLTAQREQRQYASQADIAADTPVAAGANKQNTLAGAQAYQREQALLPARIQQAQAERQLEIAQRNERDDQAALAKTQSDLAEAKAKVRRLADGSQGLFDSENRSGFRNKAGRDTAENTLLLARRAEAALQRQADEQSLRLKESGVEVARKESEVRKANLEFSRAELTLLNQKEQRIAGNAQRLGAMSAVERSLGAAAFERVKRQGIGNSSQQDIQRAGGVAPEFIRKEQERFGEGLPAYKRLRDLGAFGSDTESLAGVRRQQAQLQAEVNVGVNVDENQLAEAIGQKLGPALERLIDSIDARVRNAVEQQKTNRRIQQNQSTG